MVFVIGMFNLEILDWDVGVLELFGIFKEMLLELVLIMYVMKGMKECYVILMGFNEDILFVIGVSDGVFFNLGVNSVGKGEVVVIIGIFGVICIVIDKLCIDYKGRIFCYVLIEDYYVIGGFVNNGGVVLRWLCDELLVSEVEIVKCFGVDFYDVLI